MIYFDVVKHPDELICNTEAATWHVLHGWCWNVWDCRAGRADMLGVFYVTLLCGSGGVIHFETCTGSIPAAVLRAAFRKGIALAANHLDMVLATIPASKPQLIRIMERMGFVWIPDGGFFSSGVEYRLLKYLKLDHPIVKQQVKDSNHEHKSTKDRHAGRS